MPGYPWGQLPPPAPRKRRAGLIVGASIAGGLVIVVVILAIIGATMRPAKPVAAHSPPPATSNGASAVPVASTLSAPPSAAGYTRITGAAADRLAAGLRKQAASGASNAGSDWVTAYAKARVAFYSRDGGSVPALIYTGFAKTDDPRLSAIWDQMTPSMALDALFVGMNAASTTDHPAGPMGGILRCGTATQASGSISVCAWMDSSTLGLLMEPNVQEDELASTMLAFRAAAEH